MRRRRASANRVKIHLNFTVEEIAERLSIHPNTVRRWIKGGLPALTEKKPHLVLGRDLHAFLSEPMPGATRLRSGECYCVRCHAARRPALGMADYVPFNDRSGNLRGICPDCETLMHRRVSLAALQSVAADLQVTILQAPPRIDERASPSTNDDFQRDYHGQGKPLRRE